MIDYIIVFLVGGIICALGQLLVVRTNMTTSRILVLFVYIGVVMEAFGVFEYVSNFAHAGINVPIIGFGASMARGAIEGCKSGDFIGAFAGGLERVAAGVSAAVIFAFIAGVFCKSKTKR
ncbi:MAG: SpoVA/SpoVAEb family sporulation membrane protein [Clostridia bacterium]